MGLPEVLECLPHRGTFNQDFIGGLAGSTYG